MFSKLLAGLFGAITLWGVHGAPTFTDTALKERDYSQPGLITMGYFSDLNCTKLLSQEAVYEQKCIPFNHPGLVWGKLIQHVEMPPQAVRVWYNDNSTSFNEVFVPDEGECMVIKNLHSLSVNLSAITEPGPGPFDPQPIKNIPVPPLVTVQHYTDDKCTKTFDNPGPREYWETDEECQSMKWPQDTWVKVLQHNLSPNGSFRSYIDGVCDLHGSLGTAIPLTGECTHYGEFHSVKVFKETTEALTVRSESDDAAESSPMAILHYFIDDKCTTPSPGPNATVSYDKECHLGLRHLPGFWTKVFQHNLPQGAVYGYEDGVCNHDGSQGIPIPLTGECTVSGPFHSLKAVNKTIPVSDVATSSKPKRAGHEYFEMQYYTDDRCTQLPPSPNREHAYDDRCKAITPKGAYAKATEYDKDVGSAIGFNGDRCDKHGHPIPLTGECTYVGSFRNLRVPYRQPTSDLTARTESSDVVDVPLVTIQYYTNKECTTPASKPKTEIFVRNCYAWTNPGLYARVIKQDHLPTGALRGYRAAGCTGAYSALPISGKCFSITPFNRLTVVLLKSPTPRGLPDSVSNEAKSPSVSSDLTARTERDVAKFPLVTIQYYTNKECTTPAPRDYRRKIRTLNENCGDWTNPGLYAKVIQHEHFLTIAVRAYKIARCNGAYSDIPLLGQCTDIGAFNSLKAFLPYSASNEARDESSPEPAASVPTTEPSAMFV